MKIIIQKFGGTSVSTEERRRQVVFKVKEALAKDFFPVLVVSAMGRKGEAYATDTLLSLVDDNFKKNNLQAVDMLMCCGEIISAVVISNMLINEGIEAIPLTGGQAGIITNDKFSEADLIYTNTENIKSIIEAGIIPVVTGFQGITEKGYLTTLGRGGSDTSACILGEALKADEIEIYTDVDGIMTADPRIEPSAKILDYCDYEEVFEMAEKGAKVIHPRAVELAKSGDIVLEIKNTLNPKCKGTRIGLSRGGVLDNYEDFKSRFMTAVTHKDSIVQIKVKTSEELFSNILNEMEEKHINLDMINFFAEEKAFALEKNKLFLVEEILQKYDVKYEVRKHCAKVTLIGSKVTETPGVIAKVVRALSNAGINLLQSSDSYTSLTCLVREEDMINTVHAIHNEFAN